MIRATLLSHLLFLLSIRNASSTHLIELADFLRDDDVRVVRPYPSEVTAARQQTDACEEGLQDALTHLTDDSASLLEKHVAADIVVLCTTNNPVNRAKLWKGGDKVHKALLSMLKSLKTEDDFTSAATAAEAIWISSFNSTENHKIFIEEHAVEILSGVLMYPCVEMSSCHLTQMWSAAAMQNLAASYCHTESGHCWWEYNSEEGKLDLNPESPLKIDSTVVRQNIINDDALVSKLIDLTCQGPVEEPHQSMFYPWPSRAEITYDGIFDEKFPTIVYWAAAGVLRNLVISPESHEKIKPAVKCFCNLSNSPDWLEQGKAEETLYRLGVTPEDCPQRYDENCKDSHGWIDFDGETCESYERERWCVEFGNAVNVYGMRARDACCACGGGFTPQNEEL